MKKLLLLSVILLGTLISQAQNQQQVKCMLYADTINLNAIVNDGFHFDHYMDNGKTGNVNMAQGGESGVMTIKLGIESTPTRYPRMWFGTCEDDWKADHQIQPVVTPYQEGDVMEYAFDIPEGQNVYYMFYQISGTTGGPFMPETVTYGIKFDKEVEVCVETNNVIDLRELGHVELETFTWNPGDVFDIVRGDRLEYFYIYTEQGASLKPKLIEDCNTVVVANVDKNVGNIRQFDYYNINGSKSYKLSFEHVAGLDPTESITFIMSPKNRILNFNTLDICDNTELSIQEGESLSVDYDHNGKGVSLSSSDSLKLEIELNADHAGSGNIIPLIYSDCGVTKLSNTKSGTTFKYDLPAGDYNLVFQRKYYATEEIANPIHSKWDFDLGEFVDVDGNYTITRLESVKEPNWCDSTIVSLTENSNSYHVRTDLDGHGWNEVYIDTLYQINGSTDGDTTFSINSKSYLVPHIYTSCTMDEEVVSSSVIVDGTFSEHFFTLDSDNEYYLLYEVLETGKANGGVISFRYPAPIVKADQVVSMVDIQTISVLSDPINLNTTSTSDLTDFIYYTTDNIQVVNGVMTILGGGNARVVAFQEGNDFYNWDKDTVDFYIERQEQTLTMNEFEEVYLMTTLPIEINPQVQAVSGTYQFTTVSGHHDMGAYTIIPTQEGYTEIIIKHQGNDFYYPVQDTIRFDVVKAQQSIIVEELEPIYYTEDGLEDIVLNPTTTSGLDNFYYSVTGEVTVDNGIITFTGEVGVVSIVIIEGGDGVFESTSTTITFEILESIILSINDIEADNSNEPIIYYDLMGNKVDNPRDNVIYIEVQGSSRKKVVFIK